MMKEAIGEFGGRVRKPLRTGIGVLCIGTEITAEQAAKWPTQNRMAMARTEHVFWYPAPVEVAAPARTEAAPIALSTAMENSVTSQPSQGASQGAADSSSAHAGQPDPNGTSNGDDAAHPAGTGGEPAAQQQGEQQKPSGNAPLPPIDPETAERDELRAWLIKAGEEPAPALGTDKLRQRVRDKLAPPSAGSKQEGKPS